MDYRVGIIICAVCLFTAGFIIGWQVSLFRKDGCWYLYIDKDGKYKAHLRMKRSIDEMMNRNNIIIKVCDLGDEVYEQHEEGQNTGSGIFDEHIDSSNSDDNVSSENSSEHV